MKNQLNLLYKGNKLISIIHVQSYISLVQMVESFGLYCYHIFALITISSLFNYTYQAPLTQLGKCLQSGITLSISTCIVIIIIIIVIITLNSSFALTE